MQGKISIPALVFLLKLIGRRLDCPNRNSPGVAFKIHFYSFKVEVFIIPILQLVTDFNGEQTDFNCVFYRS